MLQSAIRVPNPSLNTVLSPIEELKSRHTLTEVIRTIPAECFRRDPVKAFGRLGITLAAVALGYLSMYWVQSAWFLPIFWVFTGTALTGLFIVGHDCAHLSFSGNRHVNALIGHLSFLPLLYPYHSWRITHNAHHAYTNNSELEEAWNPLSVEQYRKLGRFGRLIYWCYRGYFWWVGTAYYEFAVTLNPLHFRAHKERRPAWSSIAIVGLYALLFFPAVIKLVGVSGLFLYFVMPWLIFHFWNSTFTLVHHTHPEIPYESDDEWTMISGQLYSTVHCSYPSWVEFLCHDINVHVPHHLSVAIPSYNLRKAHMAIRKLWAPYLHETRFSWRTMSDIINRCYVRDETGRYVPGRDPLGKAALRA